MNEENLKNIYIEGYYLLESVIDKLKHAQTELRDKEELYEQEAEKIVTEEVIENVTTLVCEMFTHGKYLNDFSDTLVDHVDETRDDIQEYWSVSEWLGEKLQDEGESIEPDFFGLIIWGRRISGQAVSKDEVIQRIAKNLEYAY